MAAGNSGEMSFWDHLDVLRGSLFRSAAAVFAVAVVFLCTKEFLFSVILAPTSQDFFLYRWLGLDFRMELINIDISAQFFVHLKMAILSGLIISFPFLIYEVWKFIAPALYEKEKRAMRTAFGLSSGLFYLGVVTGYCIVLPVCLIFFMNYQVSDMVLNTISLNSYISMFISMVFLIGVLFEFPMVILVLSKLGVVNRRVLKSARKYAFFAIMVLAALITPADPFSMFILAIPLYGLYELSIVLCRKETLVAPEDGE